MLGFYIIIELSVQLVQVRSNASLQHEYLQLPTSVYTFNKSRCVLARGGLIPSTPTVGHCPLEQGCLAYQLESKQLTQLIGQCFWIHLSQHPFLVCW